MATVPITHKAETLAHVLHKVEASTVVPLMVLARVHKAEATVDLTTATWAKTWAHAVVTDHLVQTEAKAAL